MAVPVTILHALRNLLQIQQSLVQLQRDMRNNANAWIAMANTQSPTVLIVAGFMNNAATAYQTRLQWLTTFQDDPNWTATKNLYLLLGGTASDFTDMVSPMQQVANQLGPATKNTYAQIISLCNQILAAIDAPPTLWPE
jgi:hypothetical protein